VVRHGRVSDPEIGLDGIRYLSIKQGTIQLNSIVPLSGVKILDARNLVVAPGFIDIHSHTLGQRMNLLDGVTTQRNMEAGAFPVDFFGQSYRNGTQFNYGASVAHYAVRSKVVEEIKTEYLFGSTDLFNMNGDS
jgi:formylmethanofuran dehydrogenase subunit A